MNIQTKLVAWVIAGVLYGCGSGGVEVTHGPSPLPTPVDHGCGTAPGYDIQCQSYLPGDVGGGGRVVAAQPTETYVPFTSWQARAPNAVAQNGIFAEAHYSRMNGAIQLAPGIGMWEGHYTTVNYDTNGVPILSSQAYEFPRGTRMESLGSIGVEGIDMVRGVPSNSLSYPQTPFVQIDEQRTGLAANPYDLGWNYQSFAVVEGLCCGTSVLSTSFGAPTDGPALPTSGAATFTGKLAGLYISQAGEGSIAAASISVNADFNNRSLRFAFSGTLLTRDLATTTFAPHFDLSGTLEYLPQRNLFMGRITNAEGTITVMIEGQFYGPGAEEFGGTFWAVVNSPEIMIGAFGAKQ